MKKIQITLLMMILVFVCIPAKVNASHTHTDSCFLGTKHTCSTYGGFCYSPIYHTHTKGSGVLVFGSALSDYAKYSASGGCYTTAETYYCANKNCTTKVCNTPMAIRSTAYITKDTSTTTTTSCTRCHLKKTCYKWNFTKICSNCNNQYNSRTGSYYCSANCVFAQHEQVYTDLCKKNILYCPGKHVRYNRSCKKLTTTIDSYKKICGKTNGTYYVGTTPQAPLCASIVTAVEPINTKEQIIDSGLLHYDTTGTVTYLDGHTEEKKCESNIDLTLLGTQQKMLAYKGAYKENTKTTGYVYSKNLITVTQVAKGEIVTNLVPNRLNQTIEIGKYPDIRATISFEDGTELINAPCTFTDFNPKLEGEQKVALSFGAYTRDYFTKNILRETTTRTIIVTVKKPNDSNNQTPVNNNNQDTTNQNPTDNTKEDTTKPTTKINVSTPQLTLKTKTNQIYLTWDKVNNANKYMLYRSEKKETGYALLATVTNNSYQDVKAKSGIAYFYKVKAIANSTLYNVSKESNVITGLIPKATSITKAKRTEKKVVLNWKKTKATGYILYRSTSKNKGYQKMATITNGQTVKYTDKKIKKNKTYYYKIKTFYKVKINHKDIYIYGNTSKSYLVKK